MGTQSSFTMSLEILLLLGVLVAKGEEPEALGDELPRLAPALPEEALQTFQTKPGFVLDIVAHEPLVEDPIDAVFDEDGRLFVVEMRGYSELRDSKRGRIRLLHDDDDDGRFDRATNYVTGLRWPTSVACFDGGVFIAETPDILYCKDTDDDGVADTREVVFTGFGLGRDRLNVQAIVNGLQWGPDNRIWGATSMNGGTVGPPSGTAINLNGRDFSFDPRKRDLRAENGTAQNGMSFDTRGRRYVCSNSNHLIAVMWERDWVKPNPYHTLPNPLEGIAIDGGAAPVFRISPDEPWRIVRTRWRVAGVVGGPVEGGGRVSGYFTGASGVTIYTGDAYGPTFVNNAFTGDVGSNLVHRKVIKTRTPSGIALLGERPDDEQDFEFLASRDNWFRPTNFTNGPDGCLYITDMYREVIEHPWSLPPGIKKHLDLNSGTDRGRIYRVRPKAFARRATPTLSASSNDELAALLGHRNGWHRITAQRLLWERRDARAKSGWGDPALRRSLEVTSQEELGSRIGSDDPWLRASAMHSLHEPEEAVDLFARVSGDARFQLATFIGRMNDAAAVQSIIQSLDGELRLDAFRVLRSLGDGLNEAKASADFGDWFQSALDVVTDVGADEETRVAAAALLVHCQSPGIGGPLSSVLESTTSEVLQRQLIETMSPVASDDLTQAIVKSWDRFGEPVRGAAINALLSDPARCRILLESIQSGTMAAEALSPFQIERVRAYPEVRSLVQELFPARERRSVEALLAEYRPALSLAGDRASGHEIYQQRCVSCHRFSDEGHAVGPDLVTFQTAGPESLLTNILDPNREVAPRYQAYTLELVSGEIFVGTIASETSTHVTVRQPLGIETTVVRKDVVSMKSLGSSLMPEGLEADLAPQAMADLLAFLASPN